MGQEGMTSSVDDPSVNSFAVTDSDEERDCVIIGGGIAGLAASADLEESGVDFVLLEAGERRLASLLVQPTELVLQSDRSLCGRFTKVSVVLICMLSNQTSSELSGHLYLKHRGVQPRCSHTVSE